MSSPEDNFLPSPEKGLSDKEARIKKIKAFLKENNNDPHEIDLSVLSEEDLEMFDVLEGYINGSLQEEEVMKRFNEYKRIIAEYENKQRLDGGGSNYSNDPRMAWHGLIRNKLTGIEMKRNLKTEIEKAKK